MKKCSKCKVNKGISNFQKSGKYLRSACVDCERPLFYNKRNNKRIRLQAYVDSQKNKPCTDCKGSFKPWQMDFDHKEAATKLDAVSTLTSYRVVSLKRIIEEIAKCDLVCANCHRDRTHRRRFNVV